ncbi:MAG: RNA polymerase sporulation sigma factor SigK [Oscillospiraceae bacterium]|nr:RNA polymerase sporulation sigma factor SigK [Oscillospiraceae bacterium]
MLLSVLIVFLFSNLIFFSLHVTNNLSFPKPLSKQEEKECLEKIKEGDEEARNKLIKHNLRLVAHIIKKYYSKIKEQEDLISIGTIGLIKAVSSFDISKGAKFATYASRCIENEILMHFRAQKKLVKDVYISDPIDLDNDGNSLTLMDIVADEESISENIDNKIETEKMYELINKNLTSREKSIIYMRYGLKGFKSMPQREVAQKLNISRSYVSRIEKKSLMILKKSLKSEGFFG